MQLKNALVLGATGFIGGYIVAALLKARYKVVCAARNPKLAKLKFPVCEAVKFDLNDLAQINNLEYYLNEDSIVVNVSGVLQNTPTNDIEKVHYTGLKQLFDLCIKNNVKKITHISALGIDDEGETTYSKTKREGDNYLKSLDIDWVILQPSLVYASGCFGGTALMRAMAVFPIIPLVGDGGQLFQPVHISDLTESVVFYSNKIESSKEIVKVVGPEQLTVKQILIGLRKWLGVSEPLGFLKMPKFLIKIGCFIGDYLRIGPLNTTSYKMMEHGNTADVKDFTSKTGIIPKNFEFALSTDPGTVQSLWHANLYFLNPLLRIVLGIFWILSGAICLCFSQEQSLAMLTNAGISSNLAPTIFFSTCILDILVGVFLLIKWKVMMAHLLSIFVIIGYTLIISILAPEKWLDPVGAIIKNIPVILLILVAMAIEREK